MTRLRWLSLLFLLLSGGLTHRWLKTPAFQETLKPPEQVGAPARPRLVLPLSRVPKVADANLSLSKPEVQRRATPALSRTENVLLVGLDRKPGQTRGGRPDTIVIAAFDQKSDHLGLISVPRDLYVEIPGHGKDRINATFSFAWTNKLDPLDLLESVLEDTLKLKIKHRVAIDLGGFEALIDSLGGVNVRVPCPIVDDFIDSRTKSGRRVLKVEAGVPRLSGVEAALYVRSRHGRSDWSRTRRQQAVLLGMKHRFATVDGISHLPEFYDSLRQMLTSDMTRGELFELARRAHGLRSEHIHGLVLGVKQAAPHRTEDGKAVLLPDFAAIDEALSGLFSSAAPGTRPTAAACPSEDVALRPKRRKSVGTHAIRSSTDNTAATSSASLQYPKDTLTQPSGAPSVASAWGAQ